MITDAVGGLLVGILSGLVGALPDSPPLDLHGFGEAVGRLRAFNEALPVVEIIAMAGMCLVIVGGIFVVRLFITLYHLIPGKFT